jgi:hypothetical protein
MPRPLVPPEEKFWEKYSPHHEFPLSTVGSVALHIAAVVLFLAALWLLARMTFHDRWAVPVRAAVVMGDGDGVDGAGSGGGQPKENVDPGAVPQERNIPEAQLKDTVDELKDFLPQVPSAEEGLRPQDLPSVRGITAMSDDLRRKLLDGASGRKGSGDQKGTGPSGAEGVGSGTTGDPTSAAARSVRWELDFKTRDARDYLDQLAVMKAVLVIPQPPDWKTARVYRNLKGRTIGEPFNKNELPGVYFVSEDDDPAGVARELGLSFKPGYFIAFFPPDVAEELAAKERAYRGRKESEIFSTTFSILIRDGKYHVAVSNQKPIRR